MIRGLILFVPRVLCAVICVAVILVAAPLLAVFGRGKAP